MAVDGGIYHEQRAADSKHGNDKALEHIFVLGLCHPHNENGDIQSIDSDYGNFRAVKAEAAEPAGGVIAGKVGKVEVGTPEAAHKQTQNCGVVGHVGFFVHLRKGFGSGTIASLSAEYGASKATISNWVHNYREECRDNDEAKNEYELMQEVRKLRQQLEEAEKENRFLKKAAAFFAKEID